MYLNVNIFVKISLLVITPILFCHAEDVNIALHAPYDFSSPPTYPGCTDAGDSVQLTDGKSSTVPGTTLWTKKGTVGWADLNGPLLITLDLGTNESIDGVSYATQAGRAGVYWPSSVHIFTSEDKKKWAYAGDLIALQDGVPPSSDNLEFHRFTSHKIQASGRYVIFAIVGVQMAFCDELEVYRGQSGAIKRPQIENIEGISGINRYIKDHQITWAVTGRLLMDLASVRDEVLKAKISPQDKKAWNVALDKLATEARNLPQIDTDTFKAVFPLNTVHAKILEIHGALAKGSGRADLETLKVNRYSWLNWLGAAPFSTPPAFSIEMLAGEVRQDAILINNNGVDQKSLQISLSDAKTGALGPKSLRLFYSLWTDTAERIPVADALVEIFSENGVYHLNLPVGVPTKLWLVAGKDFPAENFQGRLDISDKSTKSGQANPISIPVSVKVSSSNTTAGTDLTLGVYDYTNGIGYAGLSRDNRDAAIQLMNEYDIDGTWASPSVLAFPNNSDFGVGNELNHPLSFQEFDDWIQAWPNVQSYNIFANCGTQFAGVALGTPEFDERVGQWAKAFRNHLDELKISPARVILQPVDEPHDDKQDALAVAWIKAIQAAVPDLLVRMNTTWERPDLAKIQEARTLPQVLCANLKIFSLGGPSAIKYYQDRVDAGQVFEFYQCSGPARLLDPVAYDRALSWSAFIFHASCIHLWSVADVRGTRTSWNEYSSQQTSFSPIFLGLDDATTSIHWEALREGREDFSLFSRLKAATNSVPELKSKADALFLIVEKLASEAAASPDYPWQRAVDPEAWDSCRLEAMKLLLEVTASPNSTSARN